jgi:hypothetical protein
MLRLARRPRLLWLVKRLSQRPWLLVLRLARRPRLLWRVKRLSQRP